MSDRKPEVFNSTLVKKNQLTHDVFELLFETEKPFLFEAGQFASIRFPTEKPPFYRPYSIASAPEPNNQKLQFFIKRIEGGPASTYICNLEEGTKVEMKGPFGHFGGDQPDVSRFYYIAIGTGIAPIKSIYEKLLIEKGIKTPMFLVYGFRHEKDQFYVDHCEEMKRRFPNFDYVVTLSKPQPEWTGYAGRITAYLQENLKTDTPGQNYYLCGVGEMVKEVSEYLKVTLGVPKERIHYERYT